MSDTFKLVPIQQVQESATNPRKHFDGAQLAELTESIKTKGIINPLLVRSVNSHFEIVAGHRRFRAATAAGLNEVPVLVRELDDAAALELQVIENLQRADVHPLDECEGYQELIKRNHLDAGGIADKIGKSKAYVLQRLALANLVDEGKEMLWDGSLRLGHAQLIARLTPEDQNSVLINDWILNHPAEELKEQIERDVLCVLDKVSFDKDDAELVEAAGPCTTCTKRTGFDKELFADITKADRCTDRRCFKSKVEAHLHRMKAAEKKAGGKLVHLTSDHYARTKGLVAFAAQPWDSGWRKALKKCPKPSRGLIVEGREQVGKVLDVCLNNACPVCNPKWENSDNRQVKAATPADRYKRRMEIWNNKVRAEELREYYRLLIPAVKVPVSRDHLIIIFTELFASHAFDSSFKDVAKLIGKKWNISGHKDLRKIRLALMSFNESEILQMILGVILERELIMDPGLRHTKDDEQGILSLAETPEMERVIDYTTVYMNADKALAGEKPKPPKNEKQDTEQSDAMRPTVSRKKKGPR